MNDLPGLTALHAWLRWPSRDSKASLLQAFFGNHLARRSLSLVNISAGRLSSLATVSISIPRTKNVVGPTDL